MREWQRLLFWTLPPFPPRADAALCPTRPRSHRRTLVRACPTRTSSSTSPTSPASEKRSPTGVSRIPHALFSFSHAQCPDLPPPSIPFVGGAGTGTCQFDQNGRPVAGSVNFSPQNFGKAQSSCCLRCLVRRCHSFLTTLTKLCWDHTDGTEEFRYQVTAVIHEMFHALGFSSSLFGQWRNSQGQLYDSGRAYASHMPCV